MRCRTLIVVACLCAPALAQYDPTSQLGELKSALGLNEDQAQVLRLALEDFAASYDILSRNSEVDLKVHLRKLRRELLGSLQELLSEAQLALLDERLPSTAQLSRELEALVKLDKALLELKVDSASQGAQRTAYAALLKTRRQAQAHVSEQKRMLKQALEDPSTSDAQIFARLDAIEQAQNARRGLVDAAEEAFVALLSPRLYAELVVRNVIGLRHRKTEGQH